MPKLARVSADRLANHFVAYLFEDYSGSNHVRRVASWIGFILKGIEKLAGQEWVVNNQRQLKFTYSGSTYKVRYNHTLPTRGGIEILRTHGTEDGDVVVTLSRLEQAEAFYLDAAGPFDRA